jgi:hypothetical protein
VTTTEYVHGVALRSIAWGVPTKCHPLPEGLILICSGLSPLAVERHVIPHPKITIFPRSHVYGSSNTG